MAINFPSGPSVNQIFYDPTSGFTYQWNGTVWVNYNYTSPAKIQELDDIKGSFNGVTQTFALTVSGSAVTPVKADQLIINIGGVAQNPGVDFTLSGSNITFTTAPASGLNFYGVLLGGTTTLVGAASTSVGPEAFTTGGPLWNTSGDLLISGVTTIANTGTASTALTVSGNARITGIVTVGSSSITIDGTNNSIKVGTGVTLSSSGVTAGIITGTFYGNGSGLLNVGIGTQGSVNTTGIVTASAFYGDGIGLLNLGGPLEPLTYSPGIGQTNVGIATNIVISFNKPIKAGVGSITLRTGSASGTIVESYDVTSSSNLSINGGVLTINPTSDLVGLTTYFVVLPAAVYKDTFESSTSVGITTYSFTTRQLLDALFIWGYNVYGHLGLNDRVDRSSPVQIPGTQWTSSSSSHLQSLATKSDGTLWSFGLDQFGQQGQNTAGVNRSSPTQIPGTQWSTGRNKISAGNHPNGAIKTDGTLWMWGYNDGGELGQNSVVRYSSPIQIPGTQWNSISLAKPTTGGVVIATKTDGTLWGWGRNVEGSLGQNETATSLYSSPRQVPGTQWSLALSTYDGFRAIKTDGTLWVCGDNSLGQLGQSNTTQYSSPVQIPGTQWDLANSSADRFLNILRKTDGTLWSFGENAYGALGQNNTTPQYSSPRQIPGTQWAISSVHTYGGTALKTDGTLWIWGYNNYGNSGLDDTIYRSSPVQVPGTQWNSKLPDASGFSPSAFQQQ